MRPATIPAALLMILSGCGGASRRPPLQIFPDMDRQPKYKPQAHSAFFADGRTSRRPVPGTVPQGAAVEDQARATGIRDNLYLGQNPLPLTRSLLERGEKRFNIYCAPCHDRTGSGRGIVSQRSSWLPSNLNEPRIRDMADGELFHIATYGKRSMPGYRFQIPESDRWAIVGYVRALQRSSGARIGDVPPELRGELR